MAHALDNTCQNHSIRLFVFDDENTCHYQPLLGPDPEVSTPYQTMCVECYFGKLFWYVLGWGWGAVVPELPPKQEGLTALEPSYQPADTETMLRIRWRSSIGRAAAL